MKYNDLSRLPLVEAEDLTTLIDMALYESSTSLTEETLIGSENFKAGQAAYHAQATLKDCPYRPYSLGEAAWILGWQDQFYLNEDIDDDYICEGDDFYLKFGWIEENQDDLFEAEYQGRKVPLGKPMRGDTKKYKVYVKNKKGNVVKVNFGDKNLRVRKSNPKRRKSFVARHRCHTAKDRTTARYWSCRGSTSKASGKW